jgi:hypothetical protein
MGRELEYPQVLNYLTAAKTVANKTRQKLESKVLSLL